MPAEARKTDYRLQSGNNAKSGHRRQHEDTRRRNQPGWLFCDQFHSGQVAWRGLSLHTRLFVSSLASVSAMHMLSLIAILYMSDRRTHRLILREAPQASGGTLQCAAVRNQGWCLLEVQPYRLAKQLCHAGNTEPKLDGTSRKRCTACSRLRARRKLPRDGRVRWPQKPPPSVRTRPRHDAKPVGFVGDKMRLQDSGDEGLRGFRGLGLRASGFPGQV